MIPAFLEVAVSTVRCERLTNEAGRKVLHATEIHRLQHFSPLISSRRTVISHCVPPCAEELWKAPADSQQTECQSCSVTPIGSSVSVGTLLDMSTPPAFTLRALTEADTEILFHIAADLSTWEERSPASPAALTRDAFMARLTQANADATSKNVRFVIDVAGTVVGSISLFEFDDLARHAEIGIALAPEARGQGLGTAAIRQLVEFAFVRCNLRRVHLQCTASNLGAIRAYEKAGFVVEGHQRQHAWVRGHYEDIVLMGVLRSEQDSIPRNE